jgi:hypothetical protein
MIKDTYFNEILTCLFGRPYKNRKWETDGNGS